jgi:cellulose biosynthesis protein BcsQ
MGDGEKKKAGTPETDDLANDVARLYSWANVEEVPYRSFSRQRRPHFAPISSPEGAQRTAAPLTDASLTTASPAPIDLSPAALPRATESTLESAVSLPPSQLPVEKPVVAPSSAHVEAHRFQPGTSPWSEVMPGALAVYSLAGGAGKTTLVANLGRLLCSMGERVLLVDASGSGLLPFYFGAGDLRPGLRTFVAPGMNYPAMHIIGADEVTESWLENDVRSAMQTSQRTIFDLGPASMSLLPQVLSLCSVLLVPLLSDLNSILTISRIEASVKSMRSRGMNIPSPLYVFNQFHEHAPMDQQARNLVLRQCGEHLLPITIRQSADVATAIGERMTVTDHSPESDVAHDYLELAQWLRKTAPVFQGAPPRGRWSEQ